MTQPRTTRTSSEPNELGNKSHWHQLDAEAVALKLGADTTQGLTHADAARRRAAYGPNELIERGRKGPWSILWEQLTATMVVILIVAAVVSAALADYKDALAILVIVVLNAVLGFWQEYRAERAMAALKQLAVPTVKVRRDGHTQELSARELVPGDIMLLEAGQLVAADGRLIDSANLRVQEAALTGESEPVEKVPSPIPDANPALGDRRNMTYMGTVVTYGRGQAVVTETGMRTELGGIAGMLQRVDREATPLQRRLDSLGRGLAIVALAIVGVIFVLGLLRGEDMKTMFLTAVTMAVAAVPEGLPAVVTIALALGAQRMLKRRALIRKLAAVETLGSVTVICSDKTGTLTENRMTAAVIEVAGRRVELPGHPRLDLRRWIAGAETADAVASSDPSSDPGVGLLLAGGALCNDAVVESVSNEHAAGAEEVALRTVGDPTEVALVAAAARADLWKADLERRFPRVAEVPFGAERRRMTTVHTFPAGGFPLAVALETVRNNEPGAAGSRHVAFTKGAVDRLLEVSAHVLTDGAVSPLAAAWRERISAASDRLAQNGMRVLGVGFRLLAAAPEKACDATIERDLVFVGMVGIIDPPRPEVKESVATCTAAGIRPVMITGDHPLTALYIARELGIAGNGRILTGHDVDRLPANELAALVDEVSVYARVSPEHKLKIVQAVQSRGHIVAMTGDGVNDAPALKKADIGVAMGITGTDVSKEAADMVLLDDNFATIVAAVEEGRVIYDNIRKFVKYLLTTNSAELWVMLVAPFLGMPLPLFPLQILWINLVTDGPTALTLGVEPAELNIMRRPPYPPGDSIFARGLGRHVLWVGVLMAALSLGTGYLYWRGGHPHWQTMVFTTLAFSQMAHVLAIRSSTESLFRIGLLSNRLLLGAVTTTIALQLAVTYVPVLQGLLTTMALSATDLAISLLVSTAVFWAVEAEKWWLRRSRR